MSCITIDNSCHSKAVDTGTNTFQNNFEFFESNNAISTTLILTKSGNGTAGGYPMLETFTNDKPSGLYKISYCYSWTNNSQSRDFCMAILIDGVIKSQARSAVITNTGGNDTDDFAILESGNNQRHITSGWIYQTLSGVHGIKLVFGRGITGTGSDSVTMSNVMIDIVKVL